MFLNKPEAQHLRVYIQLSHFGNKIKYVSNMVKKVVSSGRSGGVVLATASGALH